MEKVLNSELMKSKLKSMGKTYKDVVEATGLSYSIVEKVFSGKRTNPTSKVILPICDFLGLKMEDLKAKNFNSISNKNKLFISKENGLISEYELSKENMDTIEVLIKQLQKQNKG